MTDEETIATREWWYLACDCQHYHGTGPDAKLDATNKTTLVCPVCGDIAEEHVMQVAVGSVGPLIVHGRYGYSDPRPSSEGVQP